MTRLIVRTQTGSEVSPAQHAAVAQAIGAVLAGSRFKLTDVLLASDERERRAEMLDYADRPQRLPEGWARTVLVDEQASLFEAIDTGSDTDRKRRRDHRLDVLSPLEPSHEERWSLYLQLRFAADQAAGELVTFFLLTGDGNPADSR